MRLPAARRSVHHGVRRPGEPAARELRRLRAPGGGRVTWQQFVYFSYATLATTGYGDVVPVSAWARSLSAAEGVVGTLFLTTVVARLVGAFSGPRREEGRAVTG
ncbi:potassium channel family protein [Nocardiopsis dassonvillei]|uniref:potassium channel family protein n=1 Tax=Nocardiopsis dassonvillei TaxID=2014 RepID=UPI00200C9368|nr:potassium channel family protein [Nocardiopsis dassonvillei]MCK9869665.1 potassium channel family protein [Nocardiopsis dassonvillei]